MQLSDVVEITQTKNLKAANSMLALGWKLIAVSTSHDGKGYPVPCYVLGRSEFMPSLPTRLPPEPHSGLL